MLSFCLKFKNEDKYLCTKDYDIRVHKGNPEPIEFIYTNFTTMEELINYALTMYYDVEIPNGYKVETIYHIIFSTANFEPNDRECSIVNSSIVCSSKDKDYIDSRMKFYSTCITGKFRKVTNNWIYWHTEDFAHNQVIHSYNIDKSYIISKE